MSCHLSTVLVRNGRKETSTNVRVVAEYPLAAVDASRSFTCLDDGVIGQGTKMRKFKIISVTLTHCYLEIH